MFTVSTPAISMSKAMMIATRLSIFNSFSNTLSSVDPLVAPLLLISEMDLSMKEIMILKDNKVNRRLISDIIGKQIEIPYYLLCHGVQAPHQFVVAWGLVILPQRWTQFDLVR